MDKEHNEFTRNKQEEDRIDKVSGSIEPAGRREDDEGAAIMIDFHVKDAHTGKKGEERRGEEGGRVQRAVGVRSGVWAVGRCSFKNFFFFYTMN